MHIKLALLTACSLAAGLSAQVPPTWTLATTTTAPGMRRAGAMAFDGTRMIAYGGISPSPATILAETWAYNGQWSMLSPGQAAPPRWGHQLVRDTLRNRLVTFGGRSPTISALANDTWAWTGTTWQSVPTTVAPPPRFRYGMCYDRLRDRVVVFGGRGVFGTIGDTWEFNGTTWAQVTFTTPTPAEREDMVMTYDTGNNKTIVFGGYDNDLGLLLGDTWEYDGLQWREVTPAQSPTPRYRCAFGYDSQRQRIVIYGGYDGTQITTQTYEFTGEAWNLIAVTGGSVFGTEMYSGFDSTRNRTVTFGGVGSVFSNQTHDYHGAPTAQFNQYGDGCPTSVGIATMSAATLPRLGQQFTMELGNMPTSTAFVFTAMGFSNTTFNGSPLPLSLDQFGIAGCSLEAAATTLLGVVAANGTATYGFLVPNTPSLSNVAFYTQSFVPDLLAPNAVGGMSRGGRAVFGS